MHLVRRLRLLLIGIVALVIIFDLIMPPLLSAALGFSFPGRVAIAVALLALLGIVVTWIALRRLLRRRAAPLQSA